jgi:hypothetical protein
LYTSQDFDIKNLSNNVNLNLQMISCVFKLSSLESGGFRKLKLTVILLNIYIERDGLWCYA